MQNSGVAASRDYNGEAIEFYGVVVDIRKLCHLCINLVYIFKCDWWDQSNVIRSIVVEEHT